MLTFLPLRTGNWGKEGSICLSQVPASPKCDLNPVHQAWSPCSAELLGLLNRDICLNNQSVGCQMPRRTSWSCLLLGICWGRGLEDWTVGQLLLVSGWSSASKMSTALSIIMHFPGCYPRKTRRNTPKRSTSTTSWVRRFRSWPRNRVHPTTDTVEGTVEIFSFSSLKNSYSLCLVPHI